MLKFKNRKLNILIISSANTVKNPRPSRLVNHLMKAHKITAIGINVTELDEVETLSYKNPKKRNFIKELGLYWNVITKQYLKLVKISTRMKIVEFLENRKFDLIFCHDLVLLPIILEYKGESKIIFDAREFYPKQQEDNLRWKFLFANFNDWLCRNYLSQVDYMYTVSKNLAHAYQKDYGIECDVIMSCPLPNDLCIIKPKEKIKIIHHGLSNTNRSIHLMIEMMDYVDERFSLELMLVESDKIYYKKLIEMTSNRNNVSIIPPVNFEEIIPFINNYDIGIFLVPPLTFNLKYCLPNKFFEYIQARLVIAIGPSIDMKMIVDKYNLGIVSKDFNPKNLAKELNKLTEDDIIAYKKNSDAAAKELNSHIENEKIDKIIKGLL